MQQAIAPTSFNKMRKLIVRVALAAVVIFLGAVVVLALRWPFSQQAVLKEFSFVRI